MSGLAIWTTSIYQIWAGTKQKEYQVSLMCGTQRAPVHFCAEHFLHVSKLFHLASCDIAKIFMHASPPIRAASSYCADMWQVEGTLLYLCLSNALTQETHVW